MTLVSPGEDRGEEPSDTTETPLPSLDHTWLDNLKFEESPELTGVIFHPECRDNTGVSSTPLPAGPLLSAVTAVLSSQALDTLPSSNPDMEHCHPEEEDTLHATGRPWTRDARHACPLLIRRRLLLPKEAPPTTPDSIREPRPVTTRHSRAQRLHRPTGRLHLRLALPTDDLLLGQLNSRCSITQPKPHRLILQHPRPLLPPLTRTRRLPSQWRPLCL